MSLSDSLLLDPARLDVWIALRADGVKGSGTESDPYDGSPAAKFDALMQSLPTNTTAHIGPGIFETQGSDGWQPKSGQRIIGSGIDVTVLKVLGAAQPNHGFKAIGGGSFVTGFEASDFTVGCNLGGRPAQAGYDFPPVISGAASVVGRDVRFRRIRAINFGTQARSIECFVFYAAGGDQTNEGADCVIEDCIVEQPSLNNLDVTTCIMMISGENPINGVMAYHRGCVIRNCVVDCEYRIKPVPISQITFAGTTATVTSRFPHGRSADPPNNWVRIAGALVNGSLSNPFNGSFQIADVPSDTTFRYTMASTPTAAPVGDMWVDKWSSHFVPISSLVPQQTDTNEWTVTVTTATPHFRVLDNNVVINGIPAYNGSFKVTEVLTPTQLKYETNTNPGGSLNNVGYIGVTFQALTADGGTAAVVEGNRVSNCTVGVCHDTNSSKDLTIRNNHFRGVVFGLDQNMGDINTARPLSALTYLLDNGDYVATATSATGPHGFAVGDVVKISGATGQAHNEYFNAYQGISAVPSPTTFKFILVGNPNPPNDSGSSPTGDFARLWQVRRLVVERNNVTLVPSPATGWTSTGIRLYVSTQPDPQYVFPQVVIWNNVIGMVEGMSDFQARGIRLQYCKNALLEGNVVDLVPATAIGHYKSKEVQYFDNRTSSGILVLGAEQNAAGVPLHAMSELTTAVEDSLLVAI
jgi:hypothetical protein